jgi:hypothetical protein
MSRPAAWAGDEDEDTDLVQGVHHLELKTKICDTPRARRNTAQTSTRAMIRRPETTTYRIHRTQYQPWSAVVVHNAHLHSLAPN